MAKKKTTTKTAKSGPAKAEAKTVAPVTEAPAAVVEAAAVAPSATAAALATEPQTFEPPKDRATVAREDATVYVFVADLDPKRKGQVVKVAETLKVLGSGTAAQVADKLVADGLYTCKPPAVVPVRTWLKEFVERGVAKTA